MSKPILVALVALAGAAGTLARYGASVFMQSRFGAAFPWGTAFVNILGCFLFGLAWSAIDARIAAPSQAQARAIVLAGFMGGFTTFSSYAFELTRQAEKGEWLLAAGNFAAQNILGLAAIILGLAAGRALA